MSHPKHSTYVVLVFLIAALVVGRVSASHGTLESDTGFEIDGDTPLNAGGDIDWETVIPDPATLIQDVHSNNDPDNENLFAKGGKWADPATWTIEPGQVGSGQTELTNVMAYSVLTGEVGNVYNWLIMGMERTKQG